ncbi:MAG: HAD family hydrolase [Patescibacteria group bacterium]
MKLFVWDFHGTLEKGNERGVIALSNEALARRGFTERFSGEHITQLYGKKWYEYFAHLLPHESPATHLRLQQDCIALHYERLDIVMGHIAQNDHAMEVLEAVGKRHDQILISNTAPVHLAEFLDMVRLRRFFPQGKYFGADAHHPDAQSSKQEIAERYIAGKKFEKIVSVGDSAGDLIVADNSATYLYAHPENPHRECAADYKIRDLREVLREI